VNISRVECRVYTDADGTVGGLAFMEKEPAVLSTNLVEVGSVLCYVIPA